LQPVSNHGSCSHNAFPVFSPPPQLHIPFTSSPTSTPPTALPVLQTTVVGGPVVWKKGLYERQPFEDNYVDPVNFLQELKKNSNVKAYQYSEIVKDTFVIVQQISFIVVFVYMFALIVSDKIALSTIFAIDVIVLVGGAICFVALRQEVQHHHNVGVPDLSTMLHYGQQAILFSSVVVLLSPIFQTLTVSYTDDTIWALGITAMFMHLLLTDYAYLNAVKAKYEQGVGVNAATFGSILLASRIQSPMYGAALIGFGILCFNLSPIPRHFLKSYSVMAHVGATMLLIGVTVGCLTQVPLLAALFGFCVITICFALPWCFVKLQSRYKNQINGPWDEAKPQNSLAAAEWANAGLLS
jgi:phosphatidylinositol N-acetylglucosaminyltransferase subunit C